MEEEKKLINIDGIYYRFFLNKKSYEEDQESKDDSSSEKGASSVTTIKLETFNAYNTKSTYKHSFFVPSNFHAIIIGSQGATKKKIESETNTFLQIPMKGTEEDIVIIGSSGREIVSARHKVDTIIKSKKRVPYTYDDTIDRLHMTLMNTSFALKDSKSQSRTWRNKKFTKKHILEKSYYPRFTYQL